MDKPQIIQTIRDYLSDKTVEKAWLFGSFARSEQGNDSDVDALIELDLSQSIGLEHVHW